MDILPSSWPALAALAFMLGARHGLDADHLATVDALTRLHGRRGRWCGAWFSLGHGAVVLVVALAVAALQPRWQVPGWAQTAGAAVSLVFLLLLGVMNLRALWVTPQGQPVPLAGLRGRWAARITGAALVTRHPVCTAGVGALFAVSFDTLSQAALFAVAGATHGPWAGAGLALLFLAGMLLVDGLNGWWVQRLMAASDAWSVRASRWTSAAVAGVALGVAGWGLARGLSPWLDTWAEQRDLVASAVVLAVVAGSAGAARWLAWRSRLATA